MLGHDLVDVRHSLFGMVDANILARQEETVKRGVPRIEVCR
jgi:hypothetical protein